MIRTYTFTALVTGGVCLALIGHGNLVGDRSDWDRREAASEVLDQKASLYGRRPASTGISETVSRWGRPKLVRAVARLGDAPLQPSGARISLVSFSNVSSTLSSCDGGPDIVPAYISVNAIPTLNSQCSSKGAGAGLTCSVDTIQNSSCSANGPPNSSYCSTGTNSGWIGNFNCSVILASNSQCSAQVGSGDSCSTQSDQMNRGGWCSVNGGANPVQTGSSCSTGSLSGAPSSNATNDTCSALPTNSAGNASNATTCSIAHITTPGATGQSATCSTDGQTSSTCSVSSSSANDFCSVDNTGGGGHGGTCTVINPGNIRAFCSVLANNVAGHCSIFNDPGFSGPVNGICNLP